MRKAGAAGMRATLFLAATFAAASRDLKACSGVDDDSATPACEEWCNDPGPRRGRGGDEQEVSLMPPRPGKPKKAGPFRSRGS